MKKLAVLAVCVLMLCGCSHQDRALETGMALRTRLLRAEKVCFDAQITADYGDRLYDFSMACQADAAGSLSFTVTAPETLAGITGAAGAQGGSLTFDGTALQFDLLAEGQISPVSSPWVLLKTLRSGCLTAASTEDGLIRLSMDDSYRDDALHLDIWLDCQDLPARADILYGQKRIVSLVIKNVVIT
ncbi:MAG: hypothetical protein Q4F17_04345 [Eubacteriales bacterium]|nr:hypothetical protein [Eubacteriales bacterium]